MINEVNFMYICKYVFFYMIIVYMCLFGYLKKIYFFGNLN